MDKQLLRDIVQRDVASWSKAVVFWDTKIDWHAVNTCLELRAGTGGLSLWLAMKGKTVVCSDVMMMKEAAQLHQKYNVQAQVEYEELDATGIPYENYFDLIISKLVLSQLGKADSYALQEQAVHQMYKALKPGGKLLFAEQLRASPLHSIIRKVLPQQNGRCRLLSLGEINRLMKKFSSLDVETTGFLSLFAQSEQQHNTLAAADNKLFNQLVPQHWHYIAYGIAEK